MRSFSDSLPNGCDMKELKKEVDGVANGISSIKRILFLLVFLNLGYVSYFVYQMCPWGSNLISEIFK